MSLLIPSSRPFSTTFSRLLAFIDSVINNSIIMYLISVPFGYLFVKIR